MAQIGIRTLPIHAQRLTSASDAIAVFGFHRSIVLVIEARREVSANSDRRSNWQRHGDAARRSHSFFEGLDMLYRSWLLASALALSACSENSTGDSSSAAEPVPATPVETVDAPAGIANASPAVAGLTGIAECDNFLTAYERCIVDKVPEGSRGAFDTGLKQWKDSWKQMANDPNTKAMMPGVCAQSQAATAQSMQAYGCSFD